MAPTITYRALGSNNDPLNGQGQANFLTDIDAVAQAILTRLQMFEGEWWADVSDGLPLWQKILGTGNGKNTQAVSLIIQQRILGTPYVTGMSDLFAAFDPSTRSFQFAATVQTQFGPIAVANIPTPPPQGLPQ